MNSSRLPRTSDPSVLAAQRGAAMVKSFVGLIVVAGCFAAAILDTVSVRTPAVTKSTVHADGPPDSTRTDSVHDVDSDAELRLDPSEIADYRSNIHG